MKNLQAVKDAIVKAVPEIMELIPGCVVGHESDEENRWTIAYAFQPEGQVKQWALYSWKELDFVTITDHYMHNHMDYTYGRPITLEDVLRAIGDERYTVGADGRIWVSDPHTGEHWDIKGLEVFWHLGKPLTEQSEATIDFLHSVLCTDN